ncbi:MAG: glycosyltransferase family 1 protein [Chloroflexi bacterium]|nr:MAG: glycosyltransferase family 1 protein [Chloroflexota bacterium]
MRLFFDARYIRIDFHDGISRYTTELGKALATITPVTFIISDKAQLKFLPAHAEHVIIHSTTSAKEPLTSIILNKYNPDVVFSPMQTMGTIGRRFKLILTLHDMIYYHHRTPPHHLNMAIKLGWRAFHMTYIPQRITLNSADVVATVSHTSKSEFERVNLTKRPIVVIPNAPQRLEKFLGDKKIIRSESPRNLVYMGSFMEYKNVETLIKGMEFLPGKTLHLLSRIAPNRKAALQSLAPHDAEVIFHGGVSDQQYAEILANDAVLVSGSLNEGYGLPLAESLEMGIPAVVSDLPIHNEVAGQGALYFDPLNAKDFADKVRNLDDTLIVRDLIKEGQKHISQYRWSISAKILLNTTKKL